MLAILIELVDRSDIGVIQGCQDFSFAAKASQALITPSEVLWQQLRCDLPTQLEVLGSVDLSHSPSTKLVLDLKVGERFSNQIKVILFVGLRWSSPTQNFRPSVPSFEPGQRFENRLVGLPKLLVILTRALVAIVDQFVKPRHLLGSHFNPRSLATHPLLVAVDELFVGIDCCLVLIQGIFVLG